jgi:bifunctional DNase/RNase
MIGADGERSQGPNEQIHQSGAGLRVLRAYGLEGTMMKCERCPQAAILHITELRCADWIEEVHLCESCANRYLSQTPRKTERSTAPLSTRTQPSEAIQVPNMMFGMVTAPLSGSNPLGGTGASPEVHLDVCRIIISEIHEQQVIMLKEVGGERSFSIMIGTFEATCIDRRVKRLPCPRPLTHDAWLNTISALGASVQAACIKELREGTYYATLRLHQSGQLTEADMRPSDAVAMAVTVKVPIVIPESLLAEVSHPEEPEDYSTTEVDESVKKSWWKRW